jgi:polysaccharide biosynthesis protein PslH
MKATKANIAPGQAPVETRPKLLFLCQTLPYPPDSGVHQRSYNILRLLARRFEVTALCFYRKETRHDESAIRAAIEGLQPIARVEAFPIPQEHNRARLLWDHFRSVVMRRAYTHYAYASSAFEQRVQTLLASTHYDVIHMDSLDLCWYLPLFRGKPVVCTHHNVESRLLRRRAAAEESFLLRRYISLQAKLTEKEERFWCPRVSLNAMVSGQDQLTLSRIAPGSHVTVVPSGVDTKYFQAAHDVGDAIVFVGGYNWFPNRDGMVYFCNEILPHLRRGMPDARVLWVGHAPAEAVAEFAAHKVELTGYVDDIRPPVLAAACCIVPLRVGGGTRLKILDAWAMGKAIVSTTVGCEGLDAIDGKNILVRDDPREFADAVRAVLTDEGLRRRLAEGARLTAETQYEWDVIYERMIGEYEAIYSPSTARV